jgi:hypothetical protein
MSDWTQAEAIELCKKIEAVCPQAGYHVALTGGLLYKDGPRKDCDLLFYRIRQVKNPDADKLFGLIEEAVPGFFQTKGFGWCFKANLNGKPIDCFFPRGSRRRI